MLNARRFVQIFVLGLALAALFAAAPVRADEPVTLRSVAEVDRAAIRLSDVFANLPEGIDRDIAVAPAPGKSVTYNTSVLTRLAAQYRLDWQPQSLGDRSVLTRAATRITQDMIRTAVVAELAKRDVKGKIEVAFDNRTLEVNLPTGQAPDFALNNFDYDAPNRRFRAELMADAGTSPVVMPVMGRVTVKRDVPVLVRRLEAGTTVGESDLDWLTLTDDRVTGDVVTDAAQLIGRELRHPVAEGQPLRDRDVMLPRLVTRGGLVTLKIETPVMLITAQGRSLQDGGEGDVVRVTNTQSNRVVEGTVEATGVVRIHTAQKMANAGS